MPAGRLRRRLYQPNLLRPCSSKNVCNTGLRVLGSHPILLHSLIKKCNGSMTAGSPLYASLEETTADPNSTACSWHELTSRKVLSNPESSRCMPRCRNLRRQPQDRGPQREHKQLSHGFINFPAQFRGQLPLFNTAVTLMKASMAQVAEHPMGPSHVRSHELWLSSAYEHLVPHPHILKPDSFRVIGTTW